mmetsp:Transcript_41580/g.46334  ORF Transcript_41580/g.46334 Transcript_41580/m.46334 type:complete len:278 (-) Transcript_41580:135-968(-)
MMMILNNKSHFTTTAIMVALLSVSSVAAFSPNSLQNKGFSSMMSSTSPSASALPMSFRNNDDDDDKETTNKQLASAVLAATFVFGNIASIAPAQAASPMDDSSFSSFGDSSTVTLARGRSGGRAGGRARMSSPRSSYLAPSRPSGGGTTIINRTIVRPGYGGGFGGGGYYGGGYGYNPFGGFGLGLGLNAISNYGNQQRDYRQEGEIQDTKSELRQSQMRELEMENRIRSLEQGMNGGAGMTQQQALQMQEQVLLQMQQQTAVNNAAAAAAAASVAK